MYKVLYTEEARKRVRKCNKDIQIRIKQAVEKIASNPNIGKALTCELKGRRAYRIFDYRIIYRVNQEQIVILVLTVGHRKEVYKKYARKLK